MDTDDPMEAVMYLTCTIYYHYDCVATADRGRSIVSRQLYATKFVRQQNE